MKSIICGFFLLAFFSAVPQSKGSVGKISIDAPQLGGKRTIWIYLPENYHQKRRKYPVIYMHDAQNLFDAKSSFAGEWQIDETLDSLRAKVIVVGIEHGNEKRLAELTPFPNDKHGGGDADLYIDFVINNVKPHIDKNYRTKPGASQTAIFGSSLGGLTSFYAALKFPGIFGKAGIFSPSFWFSDKIYDLAKAQKSINAKMYFLAGDSESDDMQRDLERMAYIVRNKSNHHNIAEKIVKGGKHNENLWRENFAKAYLWLFGKKFF